MLHDGLEPSLMCDTCAQDFVIDAMPVIEKIMTKFPIALSSDDAHEMRKLIRPLWENLHQPE